MAASQTRMNTTSAMSPTLHAATAFLTRPLALLSNPRFGSPATLNTLQLFLYSTFLTTSSLNTNTLTLHCSPAQAPPIPIHLACVAAGIEWSDWVRVLGGSAFTLVIEPHRVYVIRGDDGRVAVVWAAHTASPVEVDSEDDGIDAESLSRPSSRSSNSSTFSFDSYSSASSQSSFASSIGPSKPATISADMVVATPSKAASIPMKYMYQGGVSTVLTGGVMLGAAPKSQPMASLASTSVPAPKKAVYLPPHLRTRATGDKKGAESTSWRRGGRVGA